MISFRDILFERSLDLQYKDGREKAIKIFDQQVNAVKEIMQTEGFLAIMRWWENERQAALNIIAQSDKPRPLEKARYKAANDFLQFIDSRLRAQS